MRSLGLSQNDTKAIEREAFVWRSTRLNTLLLRTDNVAFHPYSPFSFYTHMTIHLENDHNSPKDSSKFVPFVANVVRQPKPSSSSTATLRTPQTLQIVFGRIMFLWLDASVPMLPIIWRVLLKTVLLLHRIKIMIIHTTTPLLWAAASPASRRPCTFSIEAVRF